MIVSWDLGPIDFEFVGMLWPCSRGVGSMRMQARSNHRTFRAIRITFRTAEPENSDDASDIMARKAGCLPSVPPPSVRLGTSWHHIHHLETKKEVRTPMIDVYTLARVPWHSIITRAVCVCSDKEVSGAWIDWMYRLGLHP